MRVNENDIAFSEYSMLDPAGRIFFINNRVFRGIIGSENANKFKKLLNSELYRELLSLGLVVKTTISDIKVDGFDVILEHEKLDMVYPTEWSAEMFKSVALAILNINILCNRAGYELKDAHVNNFTFVGSKPILFDFGSIEVKVNVNWPAYDEFVRNFIYPLSFLNSGDYFTYKKLTLSTVDLFTLPNLSIEDSKFTRWNLLVKERYLLFSFLPLGISRANPVNALFHIAAKIFKRIGMKSIIIRHQFNMSKLLSIVLKSKCNVPKSYWQSYYSGGQELSERFLFLIDLIIQQKDISSIVDLCGNDGYFLKILKDKSGRNLQLTNVDYDENAINSGYLREQNEKILPLNFLLSNFMIPYDFIGIENRLKADLAVALAVTHHLLLTQGYHVDAIFERIKKHSNKYVLIEFMPLGLWAGEKEWRPNLPEWYNVDWFRNSFSKHFDLLIEKQTEPNRIAFFGIIRKAN